MASTDTQDAVDFVEQLELATPPAALEALHGAAPLVDDRRAAYTDAGSVVSFVTGLSATHKSDVLNSTLLAQLAASKEFDRERQTDEWYRAYRRVLEKIGWTLQEFGFSKYEAGGSTLQIDQVVLEILAAIASPGQIALATAAIDGLRRLGEHEKPFVIWDQSTHKASEGNFQIAAAQESDGVVAVSLGAFSFRTSQSTTRFLWATYSSSQVELYKAAQAVTLNEDVYRTVRRAVIEKLADNAAKFLAELPDL